MPIEAMFHFRIRHGQNAAFANAAQAFSDDIEANEPGVRSCRWLRENGGDRVLFRDLFEDNHAFVSHARRMLDGGHLEALLETAEMQGVHVIGSINDEGRAVLQELNAVDYSPTVGFTRDDFAVTA